MQAILILDGTTQSGGTPMIMHNEQLADPLNDYTRQIAKISTKRRKTDADHRDLGRLEFLGGLYLNEAGEPALPAFNILRCLQDGAKRTKRGKDVLRGVTPLLQYAVLAYDGPRTAEDLYRNGGFALRKAVGVQRARTMRTRPFFRNWSAALPVEVDPTVFDPDTLAAIWTDAGKYAGIGDMRPIYGRFRGELTGWNIRSADRLAELVYLLACKVAAHEISLADSARGAKHASVSEYLEQLERSVGAVHGEVETVGSNGAG